MKRKTLKERWLSMSPDKKIIWLGSVSVGLVGIAAAWGMADTVIEQTRFWAKRDVEVAVLDLQAEKLDRQCKSLEDRRFQIRSELAKNPRSEFFRDELQKVERDIVKMQSKVPYCGK